MYKNIVGWEKIVSKPSEAFQKWFADERKFIISNMKRNSKVLEVGCGDGRSLKDVLEVTKDITGVDNDETAIEHAKNNFEKHLSIKIILAEGNKLPFQDKLFDYATCIGTFANLGQDKYDVLTEMKRVIKDGGKIIISVYSEEALPERMKAYEEINVPIKRVSKNGTVIFDDFGEEGISEQFSKEDLQEIFDKAKLRVDKIVKSSIGYICLLSKMKIP